MPLASSTATLQLTKATEASTYFQQQIPPYSISIHFPNSLSSFPSSTLSFPSLPSASLFVPALSTEINLWQNNCLQSNCIAQQDINNHYLLSKQILTDISESENNLPDSTIVYRPTPIRPASLLPSLSAVATYSLQCCNTSYITWKSLLDLSFSNKTETAKAKECSRLNNFARINFVKQQPLYPFLCGADPEPEWIESKLNTNRMSYPREFKLLVINYYYKHGQNKYRTCKKFQITKSMLNGWLKKMEKIIKSKPGSLKSERSGRKPQFPNIEKQLFTLYCKQLSSKKKVCNKWFRDTARNLAEKQCTKQELAGMCQFSERWLSNFKKRNVNDKFGKRGREAQFPDVGTILFGRFHAEECSGAHVSKE
uniref:HTH CENPB-type domain-containing protein n=1 Tax=Syphacia muris TaxID=451379 RepID=A0A0N5A7R6_9BILA